MVVDGGGWWLIMHVTSQIFWFLTFHIFLYDLCMCVSVCMCVCVCVVHLLLLLLYELSCGTFEPCDDEDDVDDDDDDVLCFASRCSICCSWQWRTPSPQILLDFSGGGKPAGNCAPWLPGLGKELALYIFTYLYISLYIFILASTDSVELFRKQHLCWRS